MTKVVIAVAVPGVETREPEIVPVEGELVRVESGKYAGTYELRVDPTLLCELQYGSAWGFFEGCHLRVSEDIGDKFLCSVEGLACEGGYSGGYVITYNLPMGVTMKEIHESDGDIFFSDPIIFDGTLEAIRAALSSVEFYVGHLEPRYPDWRD